MAQKNKFEKIDFSNVGPGGLVEIKGSEPISITLQELFDEENHYEGEALQFIYADAKYGVYKPKSEFQLRQVKHKSSCPIFRLYVPENGEYRCIGFVQQKKAGRTSGNDATQQKNPMPENPETKELLKLYRKALQVSKTVEDLGCHTLHIENMIANIQAHGYVPTSLDEIWVKYFLSFSNTYSTAIH